MFCGLFFHLSDSAEGRFVSSPSKSGAPLGSGGDELIDVDIPDAEEIWLPSVRLRQPPSVGNHDNLGMDRRCHHGFPLNPPSPVFDIHPFPVFNPQVGRRLSIDFDDRVGVNLSHPRDHPMLGMEVNR